MAYGLYFTTMPQYQVQADTWRMHLQGLEERNWLLENPQAFLTDLFTPRYAQDTGPLGTENSLLNDLKSVLLIKFSAVCSLLTGGRYYVNLVFFTWLTFWGQVALVRVWQAFFGKSVAAVWIAGAVFLVPNTLFWASGFHKEGVLLHSLGWMSWLVYRAWQQKHLTTAALAGLALHAGVLFLLRNYLLAAAVLAGLAALSWYTFPRQWAALPAALLAGLGGLWLLSVVWPAIPLPAILAARQQEFMAMQGQSKINRVALPPAWRGFWANLPPAVWYGLPAGPWVLNKLESLPRLGCHLLFLLGFMPAWRVYWKQGLSPAAKAWLAFGASIFVLHGLLVGYTIPFLAALDRYDSLLWPFILPPVVVWLMGALTRKKQPADGLQPLPGANG